MLNNLRFPQVLLLGNGLNKSGGATGWTKLLQQIQSNKSLALDESVMEKVPYPLLAVLATGNHIDQAIKDSPDLFRFLYNGIIIKHQKTEPTYTKTSLFLCEKRRFFMARREKGVVPIIYFEKERGKSF